MIRKVRNPFTKYQSYNCFGCAPFNPIGLKLNFIEDGDYIRTEWEPTDVYQGYFDVLHGGIQATLMDEIASWYVYVKLKTAGVTSKLDIRYKQVVHTGTGRISLRAKLQSIQRNLANIEVELFDHNDILCTSGVIQYFTFPEKEATERYYYPNHEEFFFQDY